MITRTHPSWAPTGLPLDQPSLARMYDYYLGGHHNFEVDRRAAKQAIDFHPDLPRMMQVNRAFLRRAVEYAARMGIDQFLDLGSGIPTVGHVHQIVRRIQPSARVVYVDIDPITVSHSEPMLAHDPHAVAIEADIRDTDAILHHPDVRAQLDFSRPVAVLLLLVLHSILDDDEAIQAVQSYKETVVSGSYLIISHASLDGEPKVTLPAPDTPVGRLASKMHFRTYDQIAAYFCDFALEEPGLIELPRWRPESNDDLWLDEPTRARAFGGVARKPPRSGRG